MTRLRPRIPFVPEPDGGSVPARQLSPRCGQPMHPYESVWGPLLDGVVCGRPEGHNGRHRSVQSLAREKQRAVARQAAWRERRRLRDHAVPADPPPVDAEDHLPYGDPVAAGHDAGLPRLPRADVFDSTHTTIISRM